MDLVHLFVVGWLLLLEVSKVMLIINHLTTEMISFCFYVFLFLLKWGWHGCFKLDVKMHIYKVHSTSSLGPAPLPVSVMVAGMCVMVGLKGQALVIVPWSWLSDTTACLLFTPGTPAWLTAPPAPITRILYWGPSRGATAAVFLSFRACYTAQKWFSCCGRGSCLRLSTSVMLL